jgi:hypothetical protein
MFTFAAALLAACSGSDSTGVEGDDASSDVTQGSDGASHDDGAIGNDGSSADAHADASMTDAAAMDSSTSDARAADTGGADTGTTDTGTTDTGVTDTGTTDTGTTDSGVRDTGADVVDSGNGPPTVFIILMENHNWSDIKGSASAPYINGLLTTGAHAEQYYNPPGNHPSLPNYLWLESGTNFGIANDSNPSVNAQTTTAHLVNQIEAAGLTWKTYQEDIPGTQCPLTAVNQYAPKHNPFVYFTDVTNNNSTSAARCIAHVRPYTSLSGDLTGNNVAAYNFITPNLCDDMHDTCAPFNDSIKQGDTWLAQQVPLILASTAYQRNGVIFITWDEGEGGDGPIGMIVLSRFAKVGYSNTVHYTHSSLLRTVQKIFALSPYLGDAVNATDLSDLFTQLP